MYKRQVPTGPLDTPQPANARRSQLGGTATNFQPGGTGSGLHRLNGSIAMSKRIKLFDPFMAAHYQLGIPQYYLRDAPERNWTDFGYWTHQVGGLAGVELVPLYYAPEVEEVVSSPSPPRAAKLVYLAYSYHSIPHYVDALRKDLLAAGYLLFDPLEDVEHQFDEEHREPLLALKSRVPDPLVNTLRLSPLVQREVSDPSVIPLLRRGDTRSEVDSMIFKELFFLVRSSIVLCDLVLEPHACELFQKIFYAKMLDIPVIGISPIGRGVSAYVQKYLKVLLTDDFNTQNILPLVKAYTS